jgi:hypothetical protein
LGETIDNGRILERFGSRIKRVQACITKVIKEITGTPFSELEVFIVRQLVRSVAVNLNI